MLRTTLAFIVLLGAACGRDDRDHASPAAAPVRSAKKDPAAARDAIAKGAVVIDVRTADEFADDHLSQATHVPIQELQQRLPEMSTLVGGDRSKTVVVYCASGNRAGKAKSILEAAGYTHVINGGGLDDLQ